MVKSTQEWSGGMEKYLPVGHVAEVLGVRLSERWGLELKDNEGDGILVRSKMVTTEYLEPIEEEMPVDQGVECHGKIRPLTIEEMKNLMFTGATISQGKPEVNKTNKQTTMQKLTAALKRALSADKQTLYKAGRINGGLDLTSTGRDEYVNALFNNEGDHKKAVAEMVEMAKEELAEND